MTYFKWEKEDLLRIFKNEKYGKQIFNSLYSLWLPITMGFIYNTINEQARRTDTSGDGKEDSF